METYARSRRQTLDRAAQLLKKTNQFNLTTRRHSEAELAEFAADPDWDVYLAASNGPLWRQRNRRVSASRTGRPTYVKSTPFC